MGSQWCMRRKADVPPPGLVLVCYGPSEARAGAGPLCLIARGIPVTNPEGAGGGAFGSNRSSHLGATGSTRVIRREMSLAYARFDGKIARRCLASCHITEVSPSGTAYHLCGVFRNICVMAEQEPPPRPQCTAAIGLKVTELFISC